MSRAICEIARDVRKNWKNVSPYAAPYLDAMSSLYRIDEAYYYDTGRDIVARFLANASGFRGEDARRIKKELNALLA